MAKRIVVPLDGTPLGESILPHVADLARAMRAIIDLVHVVPPSYVRPTDPEVDVTMPSTTLFGAPGVLPAYSPSSTVLGYRYDPAEVAATRLYVDRVATWLRGEGIAARATVVEGADIAGAVLREAAGADLLALAANGAPGGFTIGRLVYGSISERILRDAAMPILLLRVADATS